jgi:hypothetical protein
MSHQGVRWNIFAGIIFSVAGMCLLNYYSLFPQAEVRDAEKYYEHNGDEGGGGDTSNSKDNNSSKQ